MLYDALQRRIDLFLDILRNGWRSASADYLTFILLGSCLYLYFEKELLCVHIKGKLHFQGIHKLV